MIIPSRHVRKWRLREVTGLARTTQLGWQSSAWSEIKSLLSGRSRNGWQDI